MTAPSEPVDPGWSAPATIGAWGASSPVERIRFAAANRVCVDLGYDGSVRRIEPYGLKRTMAGDLLLSAVRRESGAPRYYRVDKIEGAKITNEVFQPRFAIELWGPGGSGASPIPTPAASGRTPRPSRSAGSRASARTSGSRYVVECSYCGKQFRRRDTHLTAHRMKGDPDSKCPGRHGQLMRRLP